MQAGDGFEHWSLSGSTSIIIDLTSPEQPLIDGQIGTNVSTPTWNWSLPAGTEYFRYRLDNGFTSSAVANEILSYTTIQPFRRYPCFYIQASDVAGNWTAIGNISTQSFVSNSPLTHGDHTLEVQAQDNSFNWSDSGSFTITVDLESPDAPVVSGQSFTTDTTPRCHWTIPEDAVDIRYSINNGEWTVTGGVHVTSFIGANAMSEGAYVFQVQAMDSAGNWSDKGEYITVIDLTPPNPPTLTSQSSTNDTTPTITWVLPVRVPKQDMCSRDGSETEISL